MSLPLAFQALGDGPPVLVLHGLFGSATNWRSVGRALAARFRVLLVDLRNHGASPHAPTMGYAEMAADVRALLDAQAIDDAAIVGHSMGGKTAMRLALETPARVERLVVVDIAPAPTGNDHSDLVAALGALDLGRLDRRADADAALAGRIPDPALRQFLLQNLERSGAGWRWRLGLDAIGAAMASLVDFPEDLAGVAYPGPALFVRGERSDYLRPAHEPVVRRLFPRARIVEVAGAGHWVHAENPAGFLAAVEPFLAGG